MKRRDLIAQHTHNAIQAADKARQVSSKLRDDPTSKDFEQFDNHMHEIVEHLTTLKTYLDHQEDFAMDEVADWFSTTSLGKHTEYRHSPIVH